MWFQKISIPTPRKITGNSNWEGGFKSQIFKGKYEAKLEFLEGWEGSKTFHGGRGMDILWNNTLGEITCTGTKVQVPWPSKNKR